MASFHELLFHILSRPTIANGLQPAQQLLQNNAGMCEPNVLQSQKRRNIATAKRAVLEERFQEKPYRTEYEMRLYAEELDLDHVQVSNWFRRRRKRERNQQKKTELQQAKGPEDTVQIDLGNSEDRIGPEQAVPMDFSKDGSNTAPCDK